MNKPDSKSRGTGIAPSPAPEVEPLASDIGTPARFPQPRRREHTHAPLDAAWPGAIQSLVVTVVIALFVITFVLQAFQIPSPSMENTLLIGDYLLVDKVHFANHGAWGKILPYSTVQRGDIIVFHYPVHPYQHFVKRVIALPGDRVRIVNRRVLVNGRPINDKGYAIYRQRNTERFRDNFPNYDQSPRGIESDWWNELKRLTRSGELVVPPGRFFVLGDNRDESFDSRYWGFVPQSSVIGRPLIIYWSLTTPWQGAAAASAPDGKLKRFAYALTHPWQFTRWDRTLRLVE